MNNNLLLFSLISGTVGLISGFYIKSKLYSIVIETPPTYNLTFEEIHNLNRLASGHATPTNTVTLGEIQEVNEILGSGETTPTNSVIQGRIQPINELMDTAERTNTPHFLTQQEYVDFKEKIQRGERLSDFDKQNLEQFVQNLDRIEQYADYLDQQITAQKEMAVEITQLIYQNLL